MKRTIKEVYDLIKEKRDNALNDYRRCKGEVVRPSELKGEIDAYNDVLSLIESSHLLEEDKPVESKEITPLEALSWLRVRSHCILYNKPFPIDHKVSTEEEQYDIIEKSLKALEIIKGELFISFDDYSGVISISRDCSTKNVVKMLIPQNKYDLLKEVLL